MHHAHNETIDFHWEIGGDASELLSQAAGLVADHDGISRVTLEPGSDPDTGKFTYSLTVYLHG